MLDSIYHMTLKYLKIAFWCENVKSFPYFTQRFMDIIMFSVNLFIDFIAQRYITLRGDILNRGSYMSVHVLLNLLNE